VLSLNFFGFIIGSSFVDDDAWCGRRRRAKGGERLRTLSEIDQVKTLITCIDNLQDMVYLDSRKRNPMMA